MTALQTTYDPSVSDKDLRAIDRFVSAAVNAFGSGAGAIYGLATGDQITGAVGGALLSGAAGELAHRALSRREEARIGGVLAAASATIVLREVEGFPLRSDGFMQGSPSNWDEAAEGTLLAAKGQFEEKKLPYLGNLLAFIATTPWIDGATANFLVAAGDRISWLDMRIIQVFADDEKYPMPDRHFAWAGQMTWFEWTVSRSLAAMPSDGVRYLQHGRTKTARMGLDVPDMNLSAYKLGGAGDLLGGAMRLDDMPENELRPVYEAIVREANVEEQDGADPQ